MGNQVLTNVNLLLIHKKLARALVDVLVFGASGAERREQRFGMID